MSLSKLFKQRLHIIFVPGVMRQFKIKTSVAVAAAVTIAELLCVGLNAVVIYVDALRPKLNWKSENEAIKQNWNALWGLLVGLMVMTVLAVLCVAAGVWLHAPLWGITAGAGVLSAAFAAGMTAFMQKRVPEVVAGIEG